MTCDVGDVAILLTKIRSHAARAISGATNASPIVVTTSAAHGYATGDVVDVVGVGGNTAANGNRRKITVLSSATFSIDDSTGNGAYTSGGAAFNRTGVLVDPTTLILRVNPPTAAAYTLTYGVDPFPVKDGVGCFRAELSLNASGIWRYRWTGTGTAEYSEEGLLEVRDRKSV